MVMSPKRLQHLHAALTWAWLATIPPVILTPLRNSVPLLVGISIYANIAGHFAAWQAARTEVLQEQADSSD